MKSLYKKIGAMVLASGLLLGAGAFSSASVVHANSSFQELISSIPKDYKHKKDDIGSLISNNYRMFKVIRIYGPNNNLAGSENLSGFFKKKIDSKFIDSLGEAAKKGGAKDIGLKNKSYCELDFDGLKILIYVF